MDPKGNRHNALVICVFGNGPSGKPSINMVIVSDDPAKDDPYGRQIERVTSVTHKDDQGATAFYWE